MPRHARKFIHNGTGVVEVTPDGEQAICAEISADAERFKEELRGELSKGNKGVRKSIARWPIVSDAMGVSEEQIPEAQAILKQHGVHTDYTPDGRPVLRDRAHRKAHMKALGFYDRSAGFGDQAPEHYVESDFC